MMTLAHAAQWLSNARLVGDPETAIFRVHSDTRTVEAGDFFVALEGEKFNANHFLHEAKRLGASAVLCRAGLSAAMYPEGLARIEVQDTKLALGELATGWRSQFVLPLIAVTGSNGKTTVTQMLASILTTHAPEGAALATQGNLNNDIGVPLTLLRMRSKHRIAVVELGMNHPGEIAGLAAMAKPTVALVNNAQREHLEFMHTVEAVAKENGAVISSLESGGIAVYPHDDAFVAVVARSVDGTRPWKTRRPVG
jgi:UDP-N-acetylmuramoyl-tripeptide--D-alanyl-D-alanine ligase